MLNETITAKAGGDDASPFPAWVDVTIAGVTHRVDVTVRRDDWQLPAVDLAIALAVRNAVDIAVDEWTFGLEQIRRRKTIERAAHPERFVKRRAVVPWTFNPALDGNSTLEGRAVERYRDHRSDAGPFIEDVW